MVWARDRSSLDVVRELVGDRFDPERHRCGVDLAFLLPACAPVASSGALRRWLERDGERVAINASGLLHNPDYAARWEKKRAAYRESGILTRDEGEGESATLIITRDDPAGGIDAQKIAALVSDTLVS